MVIFSHIDLNFGADLYFSNRFEAGCVYELARPALF